MTDFRPAVDVEALLVAYLGQAPEITLLIGEGKASTKLPQGWAPAPDGDPARIRLTRIGGAPSPRDSAGHVDAPRVQFDTFAATEEDAGALLAYVHLALKRLPSSGWTYPGAVVNGTRETIRSARRPDSSTNVPSYFGEVVLTVHPTAV